MIFLFLIPGITLFGEAILASDVTPSGLSQKILTCTITNSSAGWPGSGSFDFQFNATGSFNGSYQFAPSGVFGSVANSYNLAFNGLGALYLLLNRFPVAPTNSVIRLYSEGIYSLEASPIGNRGTSRGVYTIQGGTNTAQFIVVATAMPGVSSLTYQWQRDGIDLSNATNSVLNLLAVTAPDDGEYRCMVVAYNGDRTLSVPIPTISARLHVIAGRVRSDPSLQFTVSNGRLTLSWPVGFKLQRTLQLNPPDWTDEPELSPAEIPTNESGAFYRLIAQ